MIFQPNPNITECLADIRLTKDIQIITGSNNSLKWSDRIMTNITEYYEYLYHLAPLMIIFVVASLLTELPNNTIVSLIDDSHALYNN